jgi:hypothetical protein
MAADPRAVRSAARQVELVTRAEPTQRELRDIRYWELMRSGLTNTAACKILGVSRQRGSRIRRRNGHQTMAPLQPDGCGGRYLSLPERLKIADLLGFGWSLRRISADLGRSPSTMDRHRDGQGRYVPQSADHAAKLQRRRPREHKLVTNLRLRKLVQRKLNRYWSRMRSAAGSVARTPTTNRCGCRRRPSSGRFSVAAVKAVEHELNTRPPRGLGYATPAAELRRAARQPARPAATLTGTLR